MWIAMIMAILVVCVHSLVVPYVGKYLVWMVRVECHTIYHVFGVYWIDLQLTTNMKFCSEVQIQANYFASVFKSAQCLAKLDNQSHL